jgi:hypothetical protein
LENPTHGRGDTAEKVKCPTIKVPIITDDLRSKSVVGNDGCVLDVEVQENPLN